MTKTRTGCSLDAVQLLGFGEAAEEPLPASEPGEILLRYGGWSLIQLCRKIGLHLMWSQGWYERYDWSREALPAGLYRLRVPVAGSTGNTFYEQQAMLPKGEEVAPAVLVASVLLCLKLHGQPDRLQGGWTRCREHSSDGYHFVLGLHDGRLGMGDRRAGARSPRLWVSAVRAS